MTDKTNKTEIDPKAFTVGYRVGPLPPEGPPIQRDYFELDLTEYDHKILDETSEISDDDVMRQAMILIQGKRLPFAYCNKTEDAFRICYQLKTNWLVVKIFKTDETNSKWIQSFKIWNDETVLLERVISRWNTNVPVSIDQVRERTGINDPFRAFVETLSDLIDTIGGETIDKFKLES
jgi:hypothetical protein